MKYINPDQKPRFLKILEAARDLRYYVECSVLADEYESSYNLGEIVESWDIATIPDEWENYSDEKKEIFRIYPCKITTYALSGWESDDEEIGELEGILEPRKRIRIRKGRLSFIDDESAEEIYWMTQDPKYHDGRVKSKEIARDYYNRTGKVITFREVNAIMRFGNFKREW